MNPQFGHERAACDAQDGGTAREALHLDDVHQAFALDAAEAAFEVASQKRLDAVQKHLRIGLHVGFEPEQVHAQGVGAGAEFLVFQPAQNDRAQFGKPAADDGQHLEAVHARHFQIADQQPERLGFHERQGARAGSDRADFRLAGQVRKHFVAQVQPVRIVIQNQNFMARFHSVGVNR